MWIKHLGYRNAIGMHGLDEVCLDKNLDPHFCDYNYNIPLIIIVSLPPHSAYNHSQH